MKNLKDKLREGLYCYSSSISLVGYIAILGLMVYLLLAR